MEPRKVAKTFVRTLYYLISAVNLPPLCQNVGGHSTVEPF
jgi:hypothetical protein